MSAEPPSVEDPNDPEVILRDLPEQERGSFLRQYHSAVDAAHDPAGYRRLQEFLHAWRLTVIATSQPGYYEELTVVRNGTVRTTPASEVFPDAAGLITYDMDDAREIVTLTDVTWAG